MKKIKVLIKKIIEMLHGFVDGDQILLSDLIDHITELGNEAVVPAKYADIIPGILGKLNRVMSGKNVDNLQNYITDNIHILQQALIPESPGQLDINRHSFQLFLDEAGELLLKAQKDILMLEKDIENKELIHELFRVFHTFKKEAVVLKIEKLSEITHYLESILDRLGNEELVCTYDIIDLFLVGLDLTNNMLHAFKNKNLDEYYSIETGHFINSINSVITKSAPNLGSVLKKKGLLSEDIIQDIAHIQKESGYTKKFGEIALEKAVISQEDLTNILKTQEGIKAEEKKKIQKDPLVKVRSSQINYLVDMLGELLTAQKQEGNLPSHIIGITKEIHTTVMKLRSTKIRGLFTTMNLIAQDLAGQFNKKVELDIKGADLEIDRHLVKSLEPPLTYIIRNAVCNGVDGKGVIELKARQKGNTIVISVKDDGGEREMDMIKDMVTDIGGRITMNSNSGEFTEISIIFPLHIGRD